MQIVVSFIKNKKKPYNYLVPLAMCLPFIIVAIFYLCGVAIFVVHLMLFYMIANLIVRIKNKGKCSLSCWKDRDGINKLIKI